MNPKELRPKTLNPKRKVPGWVFLILAILTAVFVIWANHESSSEYEKGQEELRRQKDLNSRIRR